MTTTGRHTGLVAGVHRSARHGFSKEPVLGIELLAGLGVDGDCHAGTTVQHRSRVRRDPTQPNLRQVHLIQTELFARLDALGHPVRPGDLGENIATSGLDLLALPTGALLRIGSSAEIQLTGLRNPCSQIEAFQPGLLTEVLHDAVGRRSREAGVMAIVRRGGRVVPGDDVTVTLPAGEHHALVPV